MKQKKHIPMCTMLDEKLQWNTQSIEFSNSKLLNTSERWLIGKGPNLSLEFKLVIYRPFLAKTWCFVSDYNYDNFVNNDTVLH